MAQLSYIKCRNKGKNNLKSRLSLYKNWTAKRFDTRSTTNCGPHFPAQLQRHGRGPPAPPPELALGSGSQSGSGWGSGLGPGPGPGPPSLGRSVPAGSTCVRAAGPLKMAARAGHGGAAAEGRYQLGVTGGGPLGVRGVSVSGGGCAARGPRPRNQVTYTWPRLPQSLCWPLTRAPSVCEMTSCHPGPVQVPQVQMSLTCQLMKYMCPLPF